MAESYSLPRCAIRIRNKTSKKLFVGDLHSFVYAVEVLQSQPIDDNMLRLQSLDVVSIEDTCWLRNFGVFDLLQNPVIHYCIFELVREVMQ